LADHALAGHLRLLPLTLDRSPPGGARGWAAGGATSGPGPALPERGPRRGVDQSSGNTGAGSGLLLVWRLAGAFLGLILILALAFALERLLVGGLDDLLVGLHLHEVADDLAGGAEARALLLLRLVALDVLLQALDQAACQGVEAEVAFGDLAQRH